MKFTIYKVDSTLLDKRWKPKGEIFFAIRGGDSIEGHKKFVEEQKEKLAYDNDDNYTSWVFTGEVFEDNGRFNPYTTVISFRIRDVY